MTDADSHRKLAANPPDEVGSDQPSGLLELPQRQKVVLVMDLVESVRLMAANERAVIDHWRGFVQHATTDVLPRHRGRMVKSLGDGIMAEFDSPRDATTAALTLQRFFDKANASLPPDQQLYLRAGLNATHVFVDDIDIYGSGVNLAARVAGLAGPGEIMVTAEVRDGLTDGLDAVVEDMGECYLKHVAEPVRAYRVGAAGPAPVLAQSMNDRENLLPRVAILPVSVIHSGGSADYAIADLVTHNLIQLLSRQPLVKVISRLTMQEFQQRTDLSSHAIAGLTKADYFIVGSLLLQAPGQRAQALLSLELSNAQTSEVIWAGSATLGIADMLAGASEDLTNSAAMLMSAIDRHQFRWARLQPIPTLPTHVLISAAIRGMHSRTVREFTRSREVLDALVQRHPRSSLPYSWLAKWHILWAGQGGIAADPDLSRRAAELARKAVDLSDGEPLAMTMHGIVQSNLLGDYGLARESLLTALDAEPSNSVAMLYMGALLSFVEPGQPAVDYCLRAIEASPLDPTRYLYDGMLATALFGAGDYPGAVRHARESLRLNRAHGSALRVLVMACAMTGQVSEARQHARQMLTMAPGFNRTSYLQRFAQAPEELRQRFAEALTIAGIPQS